MRALPFSSLLFLLLLACRTVATAPAPSPAVQKSRESSPQPVGTGAAIPSVTPFPTLPPAPTLNPVPVPVSTALSPPLSVPSQPVVPSAGSTIVPAPGDCGESSALSANDFVVFDGTGTAAGQNRITLKGGWVAGDVWGSGGIAIVPGQGLVYSNGAVFQGFKLTPTASFTLTGAEVYLQGSRRQGPPTWGLRVIKPGEFEGNGGAATTTWLRDSPTSTNRFILLRDQCTLVRLFTPATFSNGTATRLIWEMQSNWQAQDRLIIKKIVLKGLVPRP